MRRRWWSLQPSLVWGHWQFVWTFSSTTRLYHLRSSINPNGITQNKTYVTCKQRPSRIWSGNLWLQILDGQWILMIIYVIVMVPRFKSAYYVITHIFLYVWIDFDLKLQVFSMLKVPGPIASDFSQTFGDFGIRRKLIFFSLPLVNFTAEKCTVWKILMKMWLVMVTIIKLTQ